jgi:hypothetical protein
LIEENVSQLGKEVAELKRTSQRLEQDLLGAKNDVGNVQESLAQVDNLSFELDLYLLL